MVCSYKFGFQPSPVQNTTDENNWVPLASGIWKNESISVSGNLSHEVTINDSWSKNCNTKRSFFSKLQAYYGFFHCCVLFLWYSVMPKPLFLTPLIPGWGKGFTVKSMKPWSYCSAARDYSSVHGSLERASHVSTCDGNGHSDRWSSSRTIHWESCIWGGGHTMTMTMTTLS